LKHELKVDFLGNAPVAVYKLKIDENTLEKVKKKGGKLNKNII
jgi:hypothetical protein